VFRGFPIKFDEKVPEIGTDFAQNEVIAVTSINDMNGNLEIEVIGMLPNEQVEVQVLASGNPLDGIIY
jgi:hypothetical protein